VDAPVCHGRLPTAVPARWNRVSCEGQPDFNRRLVALVGLAMLCPPAGNLRTGGVAPAPWCHQFFSRTSGGLARVIGGEIFNTLGKASYVLYIIQAPVWHFWQILIGFLTRTPSPSTLFPAWQFWLFVPVLV
jgi:peptidoglycan/LPS O-acetylase OafA/YrhL